MKQIRKHEAFALRDGNFEQYVKHTWSKTQKYYVVENAKVLQFLEEYRESIRIK